MIYHGEKGLHSLVLWLSADLLDPFLLTLIRSGCIALATNTPGLWYKQFTRVYTVVNTN